jgi:CHAT domain-containing protein
MAHASLGKTESAASHIERAIRIFREISDQRFEAISLGYLGDALLAGGQLEKSETAFDKALQMFRSSRDLRGEAYTLTSLGRAREQRGDTIAALASFEQALSLDRRIQDRYGESQVLYRIARVESGRDNWERARLRLEDAISLVESLRTSVPGDEMRSSYFATAVESYELYIDALMRARGGKPSMELSGRALHVSERARARSFLDLLTETRASIRQGIDPELLEKERNLRLAIGSRVDRRIRLLSGQHANDQVESLKREIDALDKEYQELQGQIRIRSPKYSSLIHPEPLVLSQIQDQVLDEETLLLEFAFGERSSYLWVVGKRDFRRFELPSRSAIQDIAGRVLALVQARQKRPGGETAKQWNARAQEADREYGKASLELSRILLGEAAPDLKSKRLLIVPDGILRYVPFAALPLPEGRQAAEVRPLVMEFELVTLPSASALAILREQEARRAPAGKSVLVFANPMFEFPRTARRVPGKPTPAVRRSGVPGNLREFNLGPLPATQKEAEAIASVVPQRGTMIATGFDANKSTALSGALADFRVVHFATHGIVDDEHPKLSAIVLSTFGRNGAAQDGFLRLLDIYNMSLSADLVVLSACDTAVGKNVRGEGLIGLVRGFMYAGAARVVASLWKVDDESTAEFMRVFYREMFHGRKTAAAALRQAQLEMMRSKRWSAPYYWAGFIIQGEYR